MNYFSLSLLLPVGLTVPPPLPPPRVGKVKSVICFA